MNRKISVSAAVLLLLAGFTACGTSRPHPVPGHHTFRTGPRRRMAAPTALNLGTAARVLGLSRQELFSRLRAGQSLSEVAAARHVSLGKLEKALLTAKKQALDALVASGRLDESTEARIYRRFQVELPSLLEKPRSFPPGFPGVGSPGARA